MTDTNTRTVPAASRLALVMRQHADDVYALADQVEAEAGLEPVNQLGVLAYRAEHEAGDPVTAREMRDQANLERDTLARTPLDDETMASLVEQGTSLYDAACRVGDQYGDIAGRSSLASYWNEAGIALSCKQSPSLRPGGEYDNGDPFNRPAYRLWHAWQTARGETSYAADLIKRQPHNGADGCRSQARHSLMVAASSLRVHASNCRVHAQMLDDLAAGKVRYIR